jgi:tRNA A-37 threonylcarbamoyl transferase component Bud32
MTDWKHCPHCGHALGSGNSACPSCGAAVPAESGPSEHPGAPPEPHPDLDPLIADLRQSLAPNLQLQRLLGRGGMGTVFLARDPALKRNVVVKVLSPDLARDPNARKRFEREAEAAAAVSHPNVVGIHQVGELARSNTSYFVMQHVEGPTLEEEFPAGTRAQEARVRTIVGEVASALAAAHARGLVHRDIKPSNIMIERPTGRAIVLDFGISAVVGRDGDARSTKLTAEGSSIGTPQYMSPEQAAGETVTERSDVYSLGLVAFELLAGRPPFTAANPMALIAAHIKDAPPPIRSLRPDVDPDLADLVDACLAKEPSARPSARVVAHALLPRQGAVVEWPPPGLETLRGAGRAHLNRFAAFVAGELAYIYALTIALLTVEGKTAGPGVFGLFAGFGLMVGAGVYARKARRLPMHVRHARRAGFPMDVLLDVAIDPVPDTDLLLNRRGPFARLSADEVAGLIRARRVAFAWQAAGLLCTMFVPLIAIAAGDPDWLLPPVLLLPLAWYAPHWLTRRERGFRKRFVTFAPRDVRQALAPDAVTGWLATAGRAAPPASRSAPWLAHAAAGALNAALALIVLVGLVGAFNWVGVMFTLDDYPRGNARALMDSLRAARPLALAGPPEDWIGASAATDGDGSGRLAQLVSAETRDTIHARSAPLDSLAWDDLFLGVPDSVRPLLAAAAATPHLDLWRALASPAVPRTWYIAAVTEARGADSAPPSYIACRCNRSVQDLWRFGESNRAAAVLAWSQGRRADAVERLRENVRVALKLADDPVTLAPALTTLTHAAGSLVALARAENDRALAQSAERLRAYGERLTRAADAFNGATATKAASWVGDIDRAAFLDLVGDRALRPVHRWGLVRAAVEGACYSAMELYFGVDDQREHLVRQSLERVGDLPDAERFGRFLRDFKFGRSPARSWLRAVAPLLWSVRREQSCERAGVLRKAGAE